MNNIFAYLGCNHDALEIVTQTIAIIIAAIVAFTYWFQKNQERKTAATLILNQIDESEKIVDLIRRPESIENIRVLYRTQDVLEENYWQKYKVIFIRYLKNSEIECIEHYYENISLIQKGKEQISADFSEALKNQSAEYESMLRHVSELQAHQKSVDDETAQKQIDEANLASEILWNESRNFTSGVGKDMLVYGCSCFESIKGKTSYRKLEKKSYRK